MRQIAKKPQIRGRSDSAPATAGKLQEIRARRERARQVAPLRAAGGVEARSFDCAESAPLRMTGLFFFGLSNGRFWLGHADGVEDFAHGFFVEEFAFEGDFGDGAAGLDAFFGDLRGGGVADVGIERGSDGERGVGVVAAAFFVGGDAVHALGGEDVHGVFEDARGVQRVPGHGGHHDVQFELAGLDGEGGGHVGADGLEADHGGEFGHHGIDFAGHDGRAGLQRGEENFGETGVGAAGEQAQVVGDADEFEGEIAQGRGGGGHGEVGLHGVAHVVGGDEFLAGDFAELGDGEFLEFWMGVDAGADRGAAEADFAEEVLGVANGFSGAIYGRRVGAELLSESDGYGVHHMRSARCDHPIEFASFSPQRGLELGRRSEQFVGEEQGSEAHGGGKNVVGGLAEVHVIVGMDDGVVAARAAENFDGAIGDDFVGVHVEGDAGAGLVDVDEELIVQFAGDDFVGGANDGVGDFCGDEFEFAIGEGGGFFDAADRFDEQRVGAIAADGIIFDGALRLNAVVGFGGDLAFAEGIFFGALLHAGLRDVICARGAETFDARGG